MLLVFLAHFADVYNVGQITAGHHQMLLLVTRVASPAFVWISGMMLGILYHRNRDDFSVVRDRLIDRALFFLIVGHPLLMISFLFRSPGWALPRVVFITDTVAVCLIVGSTLVTRLDPWRRALLGALLLITSWILIVTWLPPIPSTAWWLKNIVTGDLRDDDVSYTFPLLPWLGFYLVSSALGGGVARLYQERRRRSLRNAAALIAAGAMGSAIVMKFLMRRLADLVATSTYSKALMTLSSLALKRPPGPAYFALYGGVALMMFATILMLEEISLGRAVIRWCAVFGRSSLACFVAQFYVYYVGVFLLPHPPTWVAPFYFAATLIPLRLLASAWDGASLNRCLTVGYGAAARRARQRGFVVQDTR